MSARSYMSIGDVLTLLRQEFPDVTISKIRFLESQGLVNPERTPSGYRKFYDHDVERLRWVLRQQREHFLPLKVIKDRLDDGTDTSEPEKVPTKMVRPAAAAAAPGAAGDQAGPGDEEHRSPEPVLVGHRATTDSAAARTELHGHEERVEGDQVIGVTLPGIDPAAARPAEATGTVGGAGSPTRSAVARPSSGSAAAPPSPSRRSSSPSGSAAASGGSAAAAPTPVDPRAGAGPGGDLTASAGPPKAADGPTGSVPTMGSASGPVHGASDPDGPVSAPVPPKGTPGPVPSATTPEPASPPTGNGTAQRSGTGSAKPPSSAPSSSTAVDLNGASLSLEELASACGLATAVLQELQSYGLLAPTVVAGVEYFDEESLAVANVAARFAQFGIEPRHLRLYKNAADREAGFVEQIVLPLVRQRNPEARVRATETVDELTHLGQQLRGSLLRSDLRGLLNG